MTEGFLLWSDGAGVPFGVALLTAGAGAAMIDGPRLFSEADLACWSPEVTEEDAD